jgi:hypothetical protein
LIVAKSLYRTDLLFSILKSKRVVLAGTVAGEAGTAAPAWLHVEA